jgi:hypothetical protein
MRQQHKHKRKTQVHRALADMRRAEYKACLGVSREAQRLQNPDNAPLYPRLVWRRVRKGDAVMADIPWLVPGCASGWSDLGRMPTWEVRQAQDRVLGATQ